MRRIGRLSVVLLAVATCPAAAAWASPEGVPTGSLNLPRRSPALALLDDGRVLAAGGMWDDRGDWTETAELYDRSTGAWTTTGNMSHALVEPKATTLQSGDVLVTDGRGAERYHPASGT